MTTKTATRVTIEASAEVVTVDIEGPFPTKNKRHGHGRGGFYNDKAMVTLVKAIKAAIPPGTAPISAGAWGARFVVYWPRIGRQPGREFPLGDVDAPISSVLDAIQKAGLLDDDTRIVSLAADKFHQPRQPGVYLTLVRL